MAKSAINKVIPKNATIVVGDIHGKTEIVDYALGFKDHNIVFVGDFLDSFDRSIDDQLNSLTNVLDAVETRNNVTAIMGNHEMSYLNNTYACSGYSNILQVRMAGPLITKCNKLLQRVHIVHGWLITHAGVSNAWLPTKHEFTTAKQIANYIRFLPTNDFAHVGSMRGGYGTGGPIWCDWNEFVPIPGINQVFGHSAAPGKYGITCRSNNYNIDILDHVNEFLCLLPNGGTLIHQFTL